MGGFRVPGPVCGTRSAGLDDGTMARLLTPAPGPMCLPPAAQPKPQWHNVSVAGGFAAASLCLSPEAVDLLKAIETLRLKPYDDQTGKEITAWVKGATIGYGHLIAEAEWATYQDGLTEAQATELFRKDLAPFEQAVGQAISVGVQQYEFDAMVILAFNIGKTGFRDSSVARIVNNGAGHPDLAVLEVAWKAWNKSQGKVSTGLNNRRAAEWRIYTSGIYARW